MPQNHHGLSRASMHFKTFKHPVYQMMVQARRDMDVPSEPLGHFYWSMRSNNSVGASWWMQGG